MLLHDPLKKKQSMFSFLWMIFFMACTVFVFAFMYWAVYKR